MDAGNERGIGLDPAGPEANDIDAGRDERFNVPGRRDEAEGAQVRVQFAEFAEVVETAGAGDDVEDGAGLFDEADDAALVESGAFLDIEQEFDAGPFRQCEDLLESGDALTAAGIELADFGEGHFADGSTAVGGAVEGGIVEDDDVAVAGGAQVDLDDTDAVVDGGLEGGEGVFGFALHDAARVGGEDDLPFRVLSRGGGGGEQQYWQQGRHGRG